MMAGYVLCTTPRSGSTLLCDLLAATGRAGRPQSFYHRPRFMREWAQAWGLSGTATSPAEQDAAYLRAAIAAGRGGTPVFGMRLQQPYLAPLSATLDRLHPALPSDAARFERAFGRIAYVHLARMDKVAQAVSLVKARQTGLWHRNADGTERERLSAPREPAYDHAAIHRAVVALARADRAWDGWFGQQEVQPMRLAYEELVARPAAAVAAICAMVGVDPPEVGAAPPGLAKLADAVSVDWAERYRRREGITSTPPSRAGL